LAATGSCVRSRICSTPADEKRAHLVSVTGIAGIGKSRLVWEFDKYMDGIAQIMYWQRGRCLSYGEGVTYWALADMVRMRCRIAEDEDAGPALAKLAEVLDQHVADPQERAFVTPRVAHLLGLEEGASFQREDLFAAWRVFFERLADVYPTVLAFEDMQWADASLLDFIEYLLEWSRQSPIFIVTSARPELLEKRPTWGAGKRNFSSIYLEPLSEQPMRELLAGLVPGLPGALCDQILARAEGVPLYAVETVRMLIDRGALVREGSAYRVAGAVESLEVPETLHALIAARLDGLSADERRVVQDGAVLGKTFSLQAVAALAGIDGERAEAILSGLVRKELLSIQTDPRSPEHGQYGFLQDLVRHVATETLSRRERYTRHLAAADYLERTFPGDEEIVEVLASHYREAYAAQPNEEGAEGVRDRARELLVRAGQRAESLGAPGEARRYYESACELTDDPRGQAKLLHRAAEMAERMAAHEEAALLYGSALEIYEQLGDTHSAARVAGSWARVDERIGHLDHAIERMEQVLLRVADDEPDDAIAYLIGRLAASLAFSGDIRRAAELSEQAVTIAEALGLPEVLVVGWMTRGLVSTVRGRPREAAGFYKMVVETGLEQGLLRDASTALGNLSDLAFHQDRYQDAIGYLEQARALAVQIGSRPEEWFTWSEMSYVYYMLGQWDDSLAALADVPEEALTTAGTLLSPLTGVLELHVHRGDVAEARRLLAIYHRLESSADVQEQSSYMAGMASLRFAEGRYREALEAGRRSVTAAIEVFGAGAQDLKQALVWSIEAAFALDEPATADDLLAVIEQLKPGLRPPYLDAHLNRLRARMADREAALERMRAAADGFRRLGIVFWLAVTELEGAELVLESDPGSDEAQAWLAEAAEIFGRLGARPWLDRLASVTQRADPALDRSV
jgi:tetratricopeptide (TPR) repeat protein